MRNKTFYKKLDLVRKITKKHPSAAKFFFLLLTGAPFISLLAGINTQTGSDKIGEIPLYKNDDSKNYKIMLTDEKIGGVQQNMTTKKDVAFVNCLTNCNCAAINCNCSAYYVPCGWLPCNCNASHQWLGGGYACNCNHQCNCNTNCNCDQRTGRPYFECNCVTNCQNPNL